MMLIYSAICSGRLEEAGTSLGMGVNHALKLRNWRCVLCDLQTYAWNPGKISSVHYNIIFVQISCRCCHSVAFAAWFWPQHVCNALVAVPVRNVERNVCHLHGNKEMKST